MMKQMALSGPSRRLSMRWPWAKLMFARTHAIYG